jgi:hypothetical protein
VLFAIGSSCFAIDPIPAYADAIGPRADAITYFVGSIFFTTAAFLQYIQAVDAPRRVGATDAGPFRLLTWEPHRVDWSSSVVQFVGTLLFNVTTFAAIDQTLTTGQSIRAVWSPDAGGSICFLVASWLAWVEVAHGSWSWDPGRLGWWIAGLNLLGSIAFGVSAVAAFVLPASGVVWDTTWADIGTGVGGVCFLVAAVLLLPERTRTAGTVGRSPGAVAVTPPARPNAPNTPNAPT